MAKGNFPIPSGPQNKRAWAIFPSLASRISRCFASSCPITSLKNMLINNFCHLFYTFYCSYTIEMDAWYSMLNQFLALLDAPFYT